MNGIVLEIKTILDSVDKTEPFKTHPIESKLLHKYGNRSGLYIRGYDERIHEKRDNVFKIGWAQHLKRRSCSYTGAATYLLYFFPVSDIILGHDIEFVFKQITKHQKVYEGTQELRKMPLQSIIKLIECLCKMSRNRLIRIKAEVSKSNLEKMRGYNKTYRKKLQQRLRYVTEEARLRFVNITLGEKKKMLIYFVKVCCKWKSRVCPKMKFLRKVRDEAVFSKDWVKEHVFMSKVNKMFRGMQPLGTGTIVQKTTRRIVYFFEKEEPILVTGLELCQPTSKKKTSFWKYTCQ